MKNFISQQMLKNFEDFQRVTKPHDGLLHYPALTQIQEDQLKQPLETARDLQNMMGAGAMAALDNFHAIGGVALQHALEVQDSLTAFQEAAKIAAGHDFTPSSFVEKALIEAEASAKYFQKPVGFEEAFFSSINDFQSFANSQLEHLSTDSSLIAARRMTVTNLSGDLLDTLSNSLFLTGELPAVTNHEVDIYVPPAYEPQLFTMINRQVDHVYHIGFDGDVDEEFKQVVSVKLAKIGSEIIEIIVQINQDQQRKGEKEIFKPTTKVLQACGRIPTFQVTTEDEFNLVLDYLFFMIYEGSATANRITQHISKTNPILDALWKLKHLRISARHDLEHGKTKDIKQKFQKVGEAYEFLIGKVAPETTRDWQKAQLMLYRHLRDMLSGLSRTIN